MIKIKQRKSNRFYEWNLIRTMWDKMEKDIPVMTSCEVAMTGQKLYVQRKRTYKNMTYQGLGLPLY